jgi:hypothetical protein
MSDDPVISRIRIARHHISEKCDHDPKKLVEYYLQRQKELEDRLLKPQQESLCTEC